MMTLIIIKTKIREALPKRFQVPLKYWFSKFSGDLEEEMRLLPKLFPRAGRVVDVGANRGVYAYPMAKLCSYVELFEPNPKCAAVLNSFAASRPNVQVHTVALSDQQGVADLQVPVDAAGIEHDSSATIEKNAMTGFRSHRVQMTTLDSFQFLDVEFIKIDVEGHESRVLDGAAETIRSQMPAMLIEIEQRHSERPISEVFNQVMKFGYKGFFLGLDGTLRPLSEFDPVCHQSVMQLGGRRGNYVNNFLFLHSKRLAAGGYISLIRGD
jgi:FkbM family methyltransferase